MLLHLDRSQAGNGGAGTGSGRPSAGWTRWTEPALPTVLISHWPMVRQPTDILWFPEFAWWFGAERTTDWHTATTRSLRSAVTCTFPGPLSAMGSLRGGLAGLSRGMASPRRRAGPEPAHPRAGPVMLAGLLPPRECITARRVWLLGDGDPAGQAGNPCGRLAWSAVS
ncbi:MAG: hypothetical protein QOH97_5220 [Actinoplanes sp.]|jgi:hypothetical protein|nr:hypothetical protein [Actinoplanes sp.]